MKKLIFLLIFSSCVLYTWGQGGEPVASKQDVGDSLSAFQVGVDQATDLDSVVGIEGGEFRFQTLDVSRATNISYGVYNVRDYGAVGDSTDATTAFRSTSTAAGQNGTVYIPAGAYVLTDSIRILGSLISDGNARVYINDSTKKCFVLGYYGAYTSGQTYNLPRITQLKHTLGEAKWGTDIAVKAVNLYSCEVHLPYIKDFGVGFQLFGSVSTVSNQIFIGLIYNCEVGVKLTPIGASGYVNDNSFYGGGIVNQSAEGTNITGHYNILLETGTNTPGENRFYGINIEGASTQYAIVTYGTDNVFYNCRLENNLDVFVHESGNVFYTGEDDIVITGGDAIDLALSRVYSFDKTALTTYNDSPLFNLSNRHYSTNPVFNIWPVAWNLDYSLTTWGYNVSMDTSKFKATGDAGTRFRIAHKTGNLSWGSGSASPDVHLSRSSAAVLKVENAILITASDTTVTATVGTIVYKSSDNHFYGCKATTGHKWWQLDN